jgi:hypothetical protein
VVDKIAAVNVSKNLAGSGCDTPLHFAVVRGNVDIVRFLLDYDANMEAKDSLGRTPLLRFSLADEGGKIKPDIMKELLERGAVVGAKDKNGQGLDWDESCVADLMERNFINSVLIRE